MTVFRCVYVGVCRYLIYICKYLHIYIYVGICGYAGVCRYVYVYVYVGVCEYMCVFR